MYESLDILHASFNDFLFPLVAELHRADDKVHEGKHIKPISKTLV